MSHDDSPDGQIGSPLDFAMDQQACNTLSVVRRAVRHGDAMLAFQPIVQSLQPDEPAFYEGLIRIVDDTGRMIPPRDFMPRAETTELGRQIDCLSLHLGLKTLRENSAIRLAVNMSARSISYPRWMEVLCNGISDECIAERLILEITESSAMGMPDTVCAFMDELQVKGVSFALDDFGAEYTSFRHLRDFNFDLIKIDGQFIREISTHQDNQTLTRALQSIAQHLDMFTVAKSVETAEDAAFLIGMGIDCLQGFYFGAPTIAPPWRTPPARSA